MDTVEHASIQEIQTSITQLSASDLVKLLEWLEGYQEQLWDKQIEEDLEAGRLDALLAEIDQEYEAGLSQPL
jgi:hypothetical protein